MSTEARWHGPTEFCPGDGTRYVMFLVRIEDARSLGYQGGCWLLTVLNMPGHFWTLGRVAASYDFPAPAGTTPINPWTIRACLLWLESLQLADLQVVISDELRRAS